ncbi:MAG TPA: hypothetical protein VGC45_00580, partial [Gryllotalpicola sp.]
SWLVGTSRSDELLLAASVSLTLTNVVGNAIEANSVAEMGRLIGRGTPPGKAVLRTYARRILLFALATCVAVGLPLTIVYAFRRPDPFQFAGLAGVMLLMALVGGVSSAFSGLNIAHGKVALPISLQSLRTVVPILLVLVWPTAPLVVYAVGFVLGELGRLTILYRSARRLPASAEPMEVPTRGLVWQSASALTAQSGPVTDRIFLARSPVGSLSSYEMADKLFFAALQVVNLGLVVRRLSRWARLPSYEPEVGRRMFRRDFGMLFAVNVGVGLLGSAVCYFASTLDGLLPSPWLQGLRWAAILFLSLPLSLCISCGGRMLIIARRQRLLVWFAATFAVLNALADWLFFVLLGPIGIPVATALVRLVSAVLYLVVVTRLLPAIIGSDLPPANPAETEAATAYVDAESISGDRA